MIKISRYFLVGAVACSSLFAQDPDLSKDVEIIARSHPQCSDRFADGKMIMVRSSNTQHSIEVHLDRFFQDVRQAGRSVIVLAPNGEPRELGCSRVLADGAEQSWKIIKANIPQY